MNTLRLSRLDGILAAAVFAVGLALRLGLVQHYQFDGLYGQDAYAYYDYARAWLAGSPPGAFYWPLGYPALLATSFALFGVSATVGQTVNLVLGALLAALIFVFVRQVGGGRLGATLAACLMLICGQALQSSLVVMADIPALTWATLSGVLLGVYTRGGQRRWLLLSCFVLALACVTRWLYLALFVPWGLSILILWRGRIRWREMILGGVIVGLVFLPQIAFSLTNPYPALNHPWVQGWSPLNAFRRDFVNIDGQFHYVQVNALFYAQPFYEAYYLAPGFALLALVGVWTVIACRSYAFAMMLGGWLLLPYIFLAGIPYQNIRFALIIVPPLLVFLGLGVDAIQKPSQPDRRWRSWLVYAALTIAFIGGILYSVQADQRVIGMFVANQQRDKQAAAWLSGSVPADATVYTFGLTLTLQHYTPFTVYELYYETPETLAKRWVRGQDDYLLLNVWSIENQWAGREPQTAFHWLRDQRGLVELARFGYYTLYKVNGSPTVG